MSDQNKSGLRGQLLMPILMIIGIALTVLDIIERWFLSKAIGYKPSANELTGLARLKNRCDKLQGHFTTFGIVAAPDDPPKTFSELQEWNDMSLTVAKMIDDGSIDDFLRETKP